MDIHSLTITEFKRLTADIEVTDEPEAVYELRAEFDAGIQRIREEAYSWDILVRLLTSDRELQKKIRKTIRTGGDIRGMGLAKCEIGKKMVSDLQEMANRARRRVV